jgi:hypothetical protein
MENKESNEINDLLFTCKWLLYALAITREKDKSSLTQEASGELIDKIVEEALTVMEKYER